MEIVHRLISCQHKIEIKSLNIQNLQMLAQELFPFLQTTTLNERQVNYIMNKVINGDELLPLLE